MKILDLEEVEQKFIEIVPEIRKCALERNNIVHNTWGINELHPDAIILFGRRTMIYKEDDFKNIEERMIWLGGRYLQ